ncbi:hypothetical protein ACIOJD_08285 [Streptomyces sp. NPDC088116]|uniref:hypothetical protein n=1 Tax=Streptomyces sp. NPDC088116 TaxID=3365825 RepID=UPI003812F91D
MTYPPNVRTAPPSAPTHAPARPSAPPAPGGPAGPPPGRHSAWTETKARLRAAATTEPGRLRIIGAALAVLVLAFGAAATLEGADRFTSADAVVEGSQPLSEDAANIYGWLADADSAAASGFLSGAQNTRTRADERERYEEDVTLSSRYRDGIEEASRLLVRAATHTDSSSESGRQIATLNEGLPRYTGLIERARANERQGLPLGGAYLQYANQVMTEELLPAAQRLYDAETARLTRDNDDARLWPYVSLVLGVAALGGLAWTQRRDYRRTNRVFNRGLVAATLAFTVLLLWLAGGQAVARVQLNNAQEQGQASLEALNDARISFLKARASENLTLIARGSVLTEDGRDQYETDFNASMDKLDAALGRAGKLADNEAGAEPVRVAQASAARWRELHTSVAATDKAGDFDAALKKVIGGKGTTGESFDEVRTELDKALGQEKSDFSRSAEKGRTALYGLGIGAGALLGLLGAVGAVLGIGRRISEYR